MTQLADITVENGASTPVECLFTAVSPQSGSDAALWYYKLGAQRTSYVRLNTMVRRSGSNSATKAIMKLNYPMVDPITGQILYSIPATVDMTVPDVATQTDIDHVFAFIKNIMASAQLRGNFKDLSASL